MWPRFMDNPLLREWIVHSFILVWTHLVLVSAKQLLRKGFANFNTCLILKLTLLGNDQTRKFDRNWRSRRSFHFSRGWSKLRREQVPKLSVQSVFISSYLTVMNYQLSNSFRTNLRKKWTSRIIFLLSALNLNFLSFKEGETDSDNRIYWITVQGCPT